MADENFGFAPPIGSGNWKRTKLPTDMNYGIGAPEARRIF